jgi:osmotically-inducible protein OsmY
MNSLFSRRFVAAALLASSTLLTGCAPLLIGGAAVGGMMVYSDRRTSGTQLEDQSIEMKAANRARDIVGDRGHVNATSYNRVVLITGEVPTEAERAAVEKSIVQVENVKSTVNELAVMGPTSMTGRSNDTVLSSKVKATFVDAKDLQSNAFKVVTERGTVYLMGRVTEREGDRATELARSVAGVQRVVRVFELLSEAELAAIGQQKK